MNTDGLMSGETLSPIQTSARGCTSHQAKKVGARVGVDHLEREIPVGATGIENTLAIGVPPG